MPTVELDEETIERLDSLRVEELTLFHAGDGI
jgi:hypothetical protein